MSKKVQSKFSVIWKETYRRNVKSAGFIFMVLMPLIMFGIFSVVFSVISGERAKANEATISLVSTDNALVQAIKASPIKLTFVDVANEQEAVQKLSDSTIDGYVVLSRNAQNDISVTLNRKATSKDANLDMLRQVVQAYRLNEKSVQLGVSPNQLQALTDVKVAFSENKLNEVALANGMVQIDDEGNAKDILRRGVAYAVVIIMFMFVMNYAGAMGQEIATEKGTRMMEVVLSSTTANTHFYGKFFGVVMVLSTQLLCYVAMAIPAYFFIDTFKEMINQFIPNVDILSTISDMIIFSIIISLIGCLIYISLSALLGSIVSKVEDVAKVMTPVTLIAVAGFYVGMFALSMPNNPVVRIFSLIPLTTPFVMPFRLAAGTVSIEELFLATGISLLSAVVILYISVLFYKTNVLIYSDKGAIKALKQSLMLRKQNKMHKS
ncbi:ABC transporter permease [Carnobacteriaceae bacterium zg-ZUI240]|nr:ABC transporter permease [Carnobacteriaceae bacterium zg-ZUI240]